ncbi:hypothetical protein LB572_19825 [Mesorhizobium sp. BH1-1-5]|uniref:hypothetical protein n=1 Tax=Mesorhizobium sp. BH1-1-5 TaxID=2876661 RepID=UPI001CCF9C99|nr:hypothetical protein [Mesorhizobium sp. BH1-1-5]MBZ9989353.1 hypothetical protein [Mesorhizobium sp. BH1-1-5]
MDETTLQLTPGLTPALGYSLLVGLGLATLVAAIVIRRLLVRNTHDFIISDRKIGFGFGVGSVISVWTWSMAVMMLIPFTRVLRRQMPNGYTISEFTKNRFKQSGVATSIVTLTMVFGIVLEILINLKGASVVMSTIFNIESILYARDGAPVTIRDAAIIYAQGMGMPVLVGTPVDIADRLEEFMDDGGADGFMLIATYTPGCFEEFVDLVVPELQRRGRHRTEYPGTTLRENLLND